MLFELIQPILAMGFTMFKPTTLSLSQFKRLERPEWVHAPGTPQSASHVFATVVS
jgi:hypothetical protein